jgi:ABC-2 type transporter
VIASDRLYLGVLAGLPVGLGLLVRVIPSPHGLVGPDNVDATSLLLVLSVGAVLSGTANAIWEIVKERAIYSRERAAGLSAGAYLVSKLVILGVLSGVQAVILVAVGLIGRPLPAQGTVLAHLPLVELMLAMFVLGVGSMALGLLLSSVVDTSEKAMPLLVLVVMAQVVLSGGIFPVKTVGVQEVSWLSPSRWGYAAAAATVDLNHVIPPANAALGGPRARTSVAGGPRTVAKVAAVAHKPAKHKPAKPGASPSAAPSASPSGAVTGTGTTTGSNTDPLWDHTAQTWLKDMIALLLLALGYSVLTWWRLVKMGPVKRK